MKNKLSISRYLKTIQILTLSLLVIFANTGYSLTPLSEEEMSKVSGQAAVFGIDKYNYESNNFYRVTVNSEVQTSLNIDRLTLKGGGGASQIDIEDFSLSGGQNNAVSSATLINPFVEFAFAGSLDDSNARDREIIGIRLGSEGSQGVMSFGRQSNNPNEDTGINVFSGYLKTNTISGIAKTSAVDDSGFNLRAGVTIIGFVNGTLNMDNARIQIPSLSPNFTAPPVTINQTGATNIIINTDPIHIPSAPFNASGNGPLNLGCFLFVVCINLQAYINDASGNVGNIYLDGSITQDLKTIHKVSIDDGFYLSAQNRSLKWRGADTTDISQPGWWLGFQGEVQLPHLSLDEVEIPRDTLQTILDRVGDKLTTTNRINIGLFDAIAALGPPGANITGVNADLNNFSNPIPLVLSNQSLGPTQAPVVNCWNGTIGC